MLFAHGWLNENALRSYPLSEAATKVSTIGVELQSDVIVDLSIVVPTTVEYPVRISHISFTGRLLSLIIRDALDVVLGAITMDIAQEGVYISGTVQSPTQRDVGTVTLGPGRGRLADFWPVGNQDFGPLGALLEPTTCVPVELGAVSSLGIYGKSRVLRNDVKLIGGDNVELEYDLDENAIVLRIKSNEGAFLPDCEGECVPGQCSQTPIQSINGVTGTEISCGFIIDGAGIVTITSRGGAVVIGSDFLKPVDLCANAIKAPDGEPGSPGGAGAAGGGGGCVCGAGDCFGQGCAALGFF
jgi:hypothetical protein